MSRFRGGAGSIAAIVQTAPAGGSLTADHTGFAAELDAEDSWDTPISIDLAPYISGGTAPYTVTPSHGSMAALVWTWTPPGVAGTTAIRFTTDDNAAQEIVWGADYVLSLGAGWTDISALRNETTITTDTGGWVEGPTDTWSAALTQGRLGYRYTGARQLVALGDYRISCIIDSISAGTVRFCVHNGTDFVIDVTYTTTGYKEWLTTFPTNGSADRVEVRHASSNAVIHAFKVEEDGIRTVAATGVAAGAGGGGLDLTLSPGGTASTDLGQTIHSVEVQETATTYTAGTLTRAGIDADLANAHFVHVTNRNDSGSGSLRDAATAASPSGPRIVVFDVGGVITLSSELALTRSNVYIAGQTAPSQGILVKGRPVKFRANDLIVRGLMIRPGTVSVVGDASNQDGVGFIDSVDASDQWLDHCDVMHSIDELCGVRTNQDFILNNISITNCLLIEPLRNPTIRHEDDHNLGILTGRGTYDYLVADTIIAGTKARSPLVETGSRGCFFGIYTHDYQTGGSPSSGQMVPLLPLTKTNSEITYLADKSVKFSLCGMYAEPGLLSRSQTSTVSPWMTWPGETNAGQGYAIFEADNWFPAGWQSVATAVGGYGGTLPSSGKALPTPGLGASSLATPQVWASYHSPTHGTETRAWTLAHAGARPGVRDACATRLVTKLADQLPTEGLSGWSASSFEAMYSSTVPADTAPTTTTSAWSETANAFTVAANGLTNVENALEALMVSLGGTWPRNVGRPIRPRLGGKLTINRDGTVFFDSLTEFAGIVTDKVISVEVTYTDGTTDTLTITVQA